MIPSAWLTGVCILFFFFFYKNKFKIDNFKLFFDRTFYLTATNRKFLYIFMFFFRSALGDYAWRRAKVKTSQNQRLETVITNCSLYKYSIQKCLICFSNVDFFHVLCWILQLSKNQFWMGSKTFFGLNKKLPASN